MRPHNSETAHITSRADPALARVPQQSPDTLIALAPCLIGI
jgi:hypothetical protein